MSSPMDLILDRLNEIAIQLKNALNNNLSNEDVNKLTNHYNKYFVALQLLDHHIEIDHKFSRLFITKTGKVNYRVVSLKNHIQGIKQSKK